MAAPGIKYDDGSLGYPANCFPVRSLLGNFEDSSGAWLSSHHAEQRRRFKAVLCAKPRTFEEIREERRRADKDGTAFVPPPGHISLEDDEEEKLLDGFFLMKHCCVEDPTDLCSVNISGQNLCDVKQEDFVLFDNVAYINAAENILPLQPFTSFPILRELEIPLNGLRNLTINLGDFLNLEILDVSYNNLAPADLLMLGLLPKLKVLHVTGNNLRSLPLDLARPYAKPDSDMRIMRFPQLEVLLLDDNKLSDVTSFAALAGLRRLRHLNMSKNGITTVPQLMVMDGRHVTQDIELKRDPKRSARKSARKSARSVRSARSSRTPRGDRPLSQQAHLSSETRGSPLNGLLQSFSTSQVDPLAPKTAPGAVVCGTEANMVTTDTGDAPVNVQTDVNGPQVEVVDGKEEEQENSDDDDFLFDDFDDKSYDGSDAGDDLDDYNALPEADEDLAELGELNLDEIDKKVEESIAAERQNAMFQMVDDDALLPPPFPELAYLDLSRNKVTALYVLSPEYSGKPKSISYLLVPCRHSSPGHQQIYEEEGLLAVAAWPLLSELAIHNNPLTSERSGDPPLLKRYLTKRLGIHITRKQPSALQKPAIEVHAKPERKVDSHVPQVPKQDIDEIIQAIEASLRPALPDIPRSATPKSPKKSTTPKPQTPAPEPQTGTSAGEAKDQSSSMEAGGNEPAEGFFMTQVDDVGERKPPVAAEEKGALSPKPPPQERDQKMRRRRKIKKPVEERYKGFEALLEGDQADVEDDVPLPKDIQGNVRALHYMLSHPLVYRENEVCLEQVQKPFKPHHKGPKLLKQAKRSREEQVSKMLTNLRERPTAVEAGLEDVLSKKSPYKKSFPEATQLLSEVQTKYNMVRTMSMKEARDVKDIARDMLEDVQKVASC